MREGYILHLPKWYPNQHDDLEGIFVQRHIQSTNPYFKSRVLFFKISDSVPEGKYYHEIHSDAAGIEEIKIYYASKICSIPALDKLSKALLYIFLFIKFYKQIQKKHGRPLLIHAHILNRTAFCAWMIYIFQGIPYVITEHNTIFTSNSKPNSWSLLYWLKKRVVSKAAALITVSKDLERGMKRFGLQNAHTYQVYNNVNCTSFTFRTKSPAATLQILHVSEFKDDHKNLTGILEALALACNKGLQCHFHLVGYGRDLEKILAMIEDLGLADITSYYGKLSGQDLVQQYQAADVLVLFSNKENMPCVIAEALCCGTPVISTPVGGIPEIISSTNGRLTPVKDTLKLAELLLNWSTLQTSFNGQLIAMDAKNLFSDDAIGLELQRIYLTYKK